MPSREYQAVRLLQVEDAQPIVLFAAPASEITLWSGIVQRKMLDEGETVGWQREENAGRVEQLSTFMKDSHNVIQNPLLCAAQDLVKCRFEPADGELGTLVIEWEDFGSVPTVELFERLRGILEGRLPNRLGSEPGESRRDALRQRLTEEAEAGGDGLSEGRAAPEGEEEPEEEAPPESALFDEETHISDFLDEVAARAYLLREMKDATDRDEFLGFTREALISYLQPVLVVDGQHRLAGAVASAWHLANDTEAGQAAIERVINGDSQRTLPNVLNVSLPGIDGEAAIVATKDLVAISNGSACTSHQYERSHVLAAMHLPEERIACALRLSWCHLTPDPDWRRFVVRLDALRGQRHS